MLERRLVQIIPAALLCLVLFVPSPHGPYGGPPFGQLSTVSTQERKVGVATDTPPQQADPEISAGAGSGLQIPSTPSDPNTVVPSTVTPPSPTSAPCSSLVAEARVLARDIAVNINVPPTSPAASNLKIIWTKRTRVRIRCLYTLF